MTKLLGMDNNIRKATSHKPVEMFLNFTAVLVPGVTARLRCTFLRMINNLILTNINGGRNKHMKSSSNVTTGIIKPFLEIIYMIVVGMSKIARRVSSLRLVTDV